MFVIKRNGQKQSVYFDKITARIQKLCWGLKIIDPIVIAQKVIPGLYPGVTTAKLDELASETAIDMSMIHPDYGELASRILVSNLHKETSKQWSTVCQQLAEYVHPQTQKFAPLIHPELNHFIQDNANTLNSAILYTRDYDFDYFGLKTLYKSYLLRINGKIVERPQHMWMRVAAALHFPNLDRILEAYEMFSRKLFIPATPTLYNAGSMHQQLSSCFLLQMKEDSIDGIYNTLHDCAQISKHTGGLGLAIHCIRSTGAYIHGTGGSSNGVVPMLRVYNDTFRYVDQGGGKRKGSCAIYLEPWHADILSFLNLKKNHGGAEETHARDLFYALWIPDLFMRRVEANQDWTLFCPLSAPGLYECYGLEFDALYAKYESNPNIIIKRLPARTLWQAILDSHMETGVPYMLSKDACNGKSNQSHLGTIQCSNLCCEIVQYTSPSEIAVCNLASLSLPTFVDMEDQTFDLVRLGQVTRAVVYHLNRVIDINYYPVPEAKTSNQLHRPIGIGVQGLQDVYFMLEYPFDSAEAMQLNKDIFETIYFFACQASMELAERDGPYSSFRGSPLSKGLFQFDLWNITPSSRYDWQALREQLLTSGIRNSLLLAPMPTATTSQILGNIESFEPITSNIYVRRTLAGEFICVNKHLMKALIKLGIWSTTVKNQIIQDNGSVQHIANIPDPIKKIYRTAFELGSKAIIDQAADRGPFICQSQSMNLFFKADVNMSSKLTTALFYAWKKGLKTLSYYIRSTSATDAIKVTLPPPPPPSSLDVILPDKTRQCSLSKGQDGEEVCEACM